MSHVLSCCNKDKDKESAFIARGHSLQSSFFLFFFDGNLEESLSETWTASFKTTFSPMGAWWSNTQTFWLSCWVWMMTRWWHSSATFTSLIMTPLMMTTTMTTNTGMMVEVLLAWQRWVRAGGCTLRCFSRPREKPLSQRWSVQMSPGRLLFSSGRLRCGPAVKRADRVARSEDGDKQLWLKH